MMRFREPLALIVGSVLLLVTACDGEGSEDRAQDTAATTQVSGETLTESTADSNAAAEAEALAAAQAATEEEALAAAQAAADAAAEALEAQQEAQGGGSAVLTIGDTTWTFDSVLCAFGPDEIGQEGAEFVLSALQDDLQLYVSIDEFGHYVSIDDIENFDDPSVSMTADDTAASLNGADEFLVELDGKRATAEGFFIDYSTDGLEGTEGTLEATCP
jgi:multidrug efflux pump subunit AcrA (membrane-fusion protein)